MTDWPADKVERRSVSALVPYARNARIHSDEQVAQIAAAIEEWGWTNPVLVDEVGGIVAGHGRVLAAQKLGLPEVPVMVASGWTDAQKRAYVLADNKLTENAGWDDSLVKMELSDLAELGFDVLLTGFGEPAKPSTRSPESLMEDVGASPRFWISIAGPLHHQADAIAAIKDLSKVGGVEVQSNLVG